MKIDKLTVEQEILKKTYFDKYFAIGTETAPADFAQAKIAISEIYSYKNLKPPRFTYVASPLVAEIVLRIYEASYTDAPVIKIFNHFNLEKTEEGLEQLINLLNKDIANTEYCIPLFPKKKFTDTDFWGQMDAFWICFYKFGEELGIKYSEQDTKILQAFDLAAKSCCWFYCFENDCIIVDRPEIISMNARRVIHNDGGPCVKFRDGFQYWALGGIRCSQEYAETLGEKLDISSIQKEENVELRMELMKKIGIKRFLEESEATLLESKIITTGEKIENKYELYLIKKLGAEVEPMPALKMFYPLENGIDSDIVVVEWVARGIKTVKQALHFRETGKIISVEEAEKEYLPPEILR